MQAGAQLAWKAPGAPHKGVSLGDDLNVGHDDGQHEHDEHHHNKQGAKHSGIKHVLPLLLLLGGGGLRRDQQP